MKILLADDERTTRAIARRMLRDIGYTDVVEATNGMEAIEAIARERPDLVLLDWNMPMKDGITLLRELRSVKQRIPIIMMTAETRMDRILEAVKAGADDYIGKPFSAETLAMKIQAISGRSPVHHSEDAR